MDQRYCVVIQKEIVTESFAVTSMTTVTIVLYCFVLKVRAAVSTPMNALNVFIVDSGATYYVSLVKQLG